MQAPEDLQKENVTGVIWLHAIVILIIWTSPFFFRWQIIIIGIAAYYIQLIIIGDCILTRKQFYVPKRSVTFYDYLLNKIGIKLKKNRNRFIADYIIPWIILGIALLWQITLNHQPLIF